MVEFSRVAAFNDLHKIDFLTSVRRNNQVKHKVLEGSLFLVSVGIDSRRLLRG